MEKKGSCQCNNAWLEKTLVSAHTYYIYFFCLFVNYPLFFISEDKPKYFKLPLVVLFFFITFFSSKMMNKSLRCLTSSTNPNTHLPRPSQGRLYCSFSRYRLGHHMSLSKNPTHAQSSQNLARSNPQKNRFEKKTAL